ncbi:MAG TPA: cupin domain-containing protein [Candidatus Acidoferrales bacterium]|nr:cupin domain-containing protein [Candidatus Acidoferrales bacterium]
MRKIPFLSACVLVLLLLAVGTSLGSAQDSRLNPAALVYKLPNQIQWTDDPIGAQTAVLAGDPSKPGLYVILVKWLPHHMSHPHWHPNDRFITVLSGTWWVGTGTKFDPDNTVPMRAGTFVKHFARQSHFDGAKDEEAVIEIVGDGPATATPAETK